MHFVFAYGSNMHLPDLGRWLREQHLGHLAPASHRRARLVDHALDWHYRSASRDGGAANVVQAPGQEVRGLLLEVSDELLAAIDRKEGHPQRYSRGRAPIDAWCLDQGRRYPAWLYQVTPAYRTAAPVPPRRHYLDLMIEGARTHALGEAYVAALRAIEAAD